MTRKVVNTYRLQLRREFSFDDARAVVSYLSRLGITHLYLSPCLSARPGSAHGYDITDHRRLNDELGGEVGFEALAAEAARHGLGLVLDFVPNHMGIEPRANPWWRDVLENGECSPYARFFDIDWKPVKPELRDRVLLPILGDRYGVVLERGELTLHFENGALVLRYFDHELPIDPREAPRILRDAAATLADSEPEAARELEAALSALEGLPTTRETATERIALRRREKEAAREALAGLCDRSPRVRAAVEEAVRSANGKPGTAASWDRLHALLEAQPYRLAYWRTAVHEINYRRFFDVNELAALRMEDAAVFEATHELVLRFLREGKIDGLRLDHVDGLLDPGAYLARLAREAGEAWIVVEKIVGRDESLPEDWAIAGTTGYDFLNEVNGLFVEPRSARRLRAIYERFTRRTAPVGILAIVCKRLVTQTTLASELNVLAYRLNRISERDRRSRDFTLDSLRDALREVVAAFPVYRTYVSPRGVSASDRRLVSSAVARAAARNPLLERSIFEFVHGCLLPEPGADSEERREFAMRFQQYATAVHAKGVEDTAFYRHHALASLCEVGGDPARFGVSPAEFHEANRRRRERWPHGMLATATHDTKRGEDVRARIDVLSEIPLQWGRAVTRWARLHTALHTRSGEESSPDRNDEWLFYQTLAGVWPPDGAALAEPALVQRLSAYLLKAAREAKLRTSWVNPNPEYEAGLRTFVERALLGRSAGRFLDSFRDPFAAIARLGALNSLAQLVLKLISPGVVDTYQGTEVWDLHLVDPDNRGPVDFELRRRLLDELDAAAPSEEEVPPSFLAELLAAWPDGRAKLFTLVRGLRLRRERVDLFLEGNSDGLHASGAHAERIVATARTSPDGVAIAVAPRLARPLVPDGGTFPLGVGVWEDTRIHVPAGFTRFRNALTGAPAASAPADGLLVGELLARWPVALLIADRA